MLNKTRGLFSLLSETFDFINIFWIWQKIIHHIFFWTASGKAFKFYMKIHCDYTFFLHTNIFSFAV